MMQGVLFRIMKSSTNILREMVGAAGFELATSSTQNLRTTKLCYAPTLIINNLDTLYNFYCRFGKC